MSNTSLIIPERAATIGNFLVGRLLPFRQKRAVGPFVFIDHMGPVQLGPNEGLDIGPHPHIGLSTLTFLFEGSIRHKDSLGNAIDIVPGAVNWMTAGKGVVHAERTPASAKGKHKVLHGLQIWVALPKALETIAPSFVHIEKKRIPSWQVDRVKVKLIAGSIMGYSSPVPVYSPLYFLEIQATHNQHLDLGDHLFGETALYVLAGSIEVDGQVYGAKQLMVAKEANLCAFTINPGTTLYLFGGTPFPEERNMFWNFVSSDKGLITQAKKDWEAQNFPKIPGETTYIPLPKPNL